MLNEDIIKNSKKVITNARQIEAMFKSSGWKHFQEVKEKKKQMMVDKVFKSEMTIKKHEYNRGGINFINEIEAELQGMIDEATNASEVIEKLED